MHVISLKGENAHFQRNSKHEKSDDEPQISLRNSPAESVVAEVASLTKDNKFSFCDVVKPVRGNFIGFMLLQPTQMTLPESMKLMSYK